MTTQEVNTMNASMAISVEGGRYNLTDIPHTASSKSVFLQLLIQHRHVLYNWGEHCLYTCTIPFRFDYNHIHAIDAEGGKIVNSDYWISINPEELHTLLSEIFEGEWGPTAADMIVRLLRSGIDVDIYNCAQHGPSHPKIFLENLRQTVCY